MLTAWTASLQRTLRGNLVGTASYFGNKGTHILTTTYANLVNPVTGAPPPYPQFGVVSWRGNVGNSTFHANRSVKIKKMVIAKTDKVVIDHWVKLYNRLTGSTYRIADWPDKDSSKKNVDATCIDDAGHKLGIEHTLIQPFENEKADAARFLPTLGALENDPALVQAGYVYLVSQPVGRARRE